MDNWWFSRWSSVLNLLKTETLDSKNETKLVESIRQCTLECPFPLAAVSHFAQLGIRLNSWAESKVAGFPAGLTLQQACVLHSILGHIVDIFDEIERLVRSSVLNVVNELQKSGKFDNELMKKYIFTIEIRHVLECFDEYDENDPLEMEKLSPEIAYSMESFKILRGKLTNLMEPEFVSVAVQLWKRTKSPEDLFSQFLVPILLELSKMHELTKLSLGESLVSGIRDSFDSISGGKEVIRFIRESVRPGEENQLKEEERIMVSDVLMHST